jgi:hypothetical protein
MLQIKKLFLIVLTSIFAIEFTSWIGFSFTATMPLFWLVAILITGFLTWRRLEYGLTILLTELCIGSQGYLLWIWLDGNKISLRIGLFAIVFVVGLLQHFQLQTLKARRKTLWPFYMLAVFVALGALLGFVRNSTSNAFFDLNGWLYSGLLLILASSQINVRLEQILTVLTAATTWLCVKTIAVLFMFSHALVFLHEPFYDWIRDTRVGEITYITGTLFRIFFQSHLYVGIGLLIALALLLHQQITNQNLRRLAWLYVWLSSLTIVISQSRSFWVGGLVALFFLFALAKYNGTTWKRIGVYLTILVALLLSHYVTLNLITGNSAALIDRFRGLNDAASSSRMQQLEPLWTEIIKHPIIGSGFGTQITYQSNDPRVLVNNPDGWHTTYAFEWGYLDIWLKIGALGLFAYLIVLGNILQMMIKKTTEQRIVFSGLIAGLIFLIVTNMFSPYLNHPLGIGYLLLLQVILHLIHTARSIATASTAGVLPACAGMTD